MHANCNAEIMYVSLMISLPFVKFPEHHSAKITYLRISVYMCGEDEDDLLIAHMMPVGRLGMELRWLDSENNKADNNYVQYRCFLVIIALSLLNYFSQN